MIAALALALALVDLGKPPKQPDLGDYWRVDNLRNANEIHIHPVWTHDNPHWVRLYGIDVPDVGRRGYSGARQALEILLGREPDVRYEDDKKDHPVIRNADYVQYVWAYGKLLEYELILDGWATVNEEGRRGKYAKYLLTAQDQAKRWKEGIWSSNPTMP